MATHALERTSPKGGPFIGRCIKCGKENIPISDFSDGCTSEMTDDEALIKAIRDKD